MLFRSDALLKWNSGETASAQAAIEEAISQAKELNDMHGLAVALLIAAVLAQLEGKPAEAERLASELIELSTPAPRCVSRGYGR